MLETEVLKAIDCCSEFLCGECPYSKYEHKDYLLKCSYKLMQDIKFLVDKQRQQGAIKNLKEEEDI